MITEIVIFFCTQKAPLLCKEKLITIHKDHNAVYFFSVNTMNYISKIMKKVKIVASAIYHVKQKCLSVLNSVLCTAIIKHFACILLQFYEFPMA